VTDDPLVLKHLNALGFGPEDQSRRRAQTEQAQQERWGVTGLSILGIEEDTEAAQRDAEWAVTSLIDDLAELLADVT
jgi:hypothetical protein